MSDKKVIIVGGGNAGLSAAYTLFKDGVDFDLFEASDRYGGRVGRKDFKHGSYNKGAYFTEPQWKTTFEYLNEFGIIDDVSELSTKVYGFWLKGEVRYFVDEGNLFASILKFKGLPAAIFPQGAKFVASLAKAMPLVDEKNHDFSKLSDISEMSTTEWATKHGGPEVVDKLIGPMLNTMVLARPEEICAAHPIALMKLMQGMCLVKGGLKRVNDTIYDRVKDHVHLSSPVANIVIENDKIKGIKLVSGEFVEADEIICATDAVDALKLMPNLPNTIKGPLKTCKYSSTFHYVYYLPERNVPEGFQALMIPGSANSLLTTMFDENSTDMYATPGSGLMHIYTAGWHDDKFLPLSEEDREKLMLSEADKFFPGFSEKAEFVACTRYDRAVNTEPPGQFNAIQNMLKNHKEDVKGLHLAGEYLFLIACSEGAWSTGKDAAQEIIEKQ